MTFVFAPPAVASRLDRRITPGVATGLVENFSASREAFLSSDLSVSRGRNLAAAYDPIVAALNAGLPPEAQLPHPYRRTTEAAERKRFSATFESPADPQGLLEQRIWEAVAARREAEPGFGAELPKDREDLRRRIREDVRRSQADAADVGARATAAGTVGRFAGGVAASFEDPIIVGSLFAGAPGAAGILRTAIVEGAIGVGSEALIQPLVAQYREALGLEYTAKDFLRNVAFAGAGGFLLGGAVKGAARGLPKAFEAAAPHGRKLLEAFDRHVKRPTAEQAAARADFEDALDTADANPLPGDAAGVTEHTARLDTAIAAAEEGAPPTASALPDRPAAPVRPPETVGDNLDGLIWKFDPGEIEVDAKVFQFKSGGDSFGVTERLRGIRKWDPVKSGQIVVYEFAPSPAFPSGRRVIADGHQRLALAKRIQAQGLSREGGQQPVLFGQLLREADGVTPDAARVIAAVKNIAEGAGSAVDAAKVLRISPGRIRELPLSSNLVRTARDLVELSDEAFGLVVNEVVPAHFAAVVGRLAGGDPGLQMAVLDVLARTDPANLTQAEAIARQAIAAGTARSTQQTLFGAAEITESLFKERARVLDAALRRLKRDRSVFASLNRNQARIEAEGNQLDPAANRVRETTDAQAQQTLQILANRKGPLADALNAAAGRAKADGRIGPAADEFVDAVRGAVERGDFNGAAVRPDGRDLEAAPQDPGGPDRPGQAEVAAAAGRTQEQLAEFETPGGKAQAEQADALEAEIRDANAPAETPAATAAPPRAPWPEDFPDIAVHHGGSSPKRITRHPDFDAAKAGDEPAAQRVVLDMIDDARIEAIRETLAGRTPVVVAVHAEDLTGRNRIPTAYGAELAHRLGLPIDDAIVQAAPARRRGSGAFELFGKRVAFDGRVEPGVDYLLADDHLTVGGTLADLRAHIEAGGGNAIMATTLTASRNEVRLAVDPANLTRLREKFPDLEPEWKARFGHGFEGLTDAEAKILLKARSSDAVRNRLAAAGQAAERGADDAQPGAPRRGGEAGGEDGGETRGLAEPPPEAFDLDVPVGERLDPETGTARAETRPAGDLLDEIDADREFSEQLDLCGKSNAGES